MIENEFVCAYICVCKCILNVEHVLYESLAQKLGWQFTGRSKYAVSAGLVASSKNYELLKNFAKIFEK